MIEQEEIKIKKEQRLEEQETKTLKGKIIWFSGTKGYGFIKIQDSGKDVFIHSSAIKDSGLKYLNKDDELMFEVENTDKGPSAINLQKMSQSKKEN